jgi:hypothetical protein
MLALGALIIRLCLLLFDLDDIGGLDLVVALLPRFVARRLLRCAACATLDGLLAGLRDAEPAGDVSSLTDLLAAAAPHRARNLLALFDDAALGRDQLHQRQDPPLPVVVGPHDDQQVFDRDDEDQRPDHQREDAQDIAL